MVRACFRKEDENVTVKTLKIEVSSSRGIPKQTWKKQVENEMKENGLVKEDACDQTKWRGMVKAMTILNSANSIMRIILDPTCDDNLFCQHDFRIRKLTLS